MIREFREFALKGSLIDVAVGFVLGAAFATLVTSLVADVITPVISALFGQPDFSGLAIVIGDSEIRYGSFLNAVFSFLLVTLALFLFVVKPYNAWKNRGAGGEEALLEQTTEEIVLLTEIRDALRQA